MATSALQWHVHQMDGSALLNLDISCALPPPCHEIVKPEKAFCGNIYHALTALTLKAKDAAAVLSLHEHVNGIARLQGKLDAPLSKSRECWSKQRKVKENPSTFFLLPFTSCSLCPYSLCCFLVYLKHQIARVQLDAFHTLISDRFHHPKPFRICTLALSWP